MVDPGFDSEHEFDQQLREALRTRPAPQGFTERVMRRVPGPRVIQKRRRTTLFFRFPAAARLAAVASVLVAVLVGGMVYQRQRQIAGERARQQVLLALRITGTTLQQVEQKVNQNGKEVQP